MKHVPLFALFLVLVTLTFDLPVTAADHHGHGHYAHGTACIVKGSYCSCHYCKCEKGWVHCGKKHGYGKSYLIELIMKGWKLNKYPLMC